MRRFILRAVGIGLATGLALAVGVLLMFLWPANPPFWPIVFLPVLPTGILAVRWALPRRGGAGRAVLVGLIAGLVAGAISASALYAAVAQGRAIYGLAGILRAPPFYLGPYNWFGDVPWPLPLLVPLGAALSALQAWLYYLLLAEPDADLRGALADWIARRRIALQSKLVIGFLVLVAGILVVGWAGFAAMEDMHLRLHGVELRAEWWGHLRTVQTAIQEERALLDELAAAPRPESLDRLRQLDTQVQGELAHLTNYGPHPTVFVMGLERIRQEMAVLRPLIQDVTPAYTAFSTAMLQTAEARVAGDGARAAALDQTVGPSQRALEGALDRLAAELGGGLFASLLQMDAQNHGTLAQFMLLILVFTTLAMLLGIVLAHAIVRPVHAVSRELNYIGKGDFSQRVEVVNADELGSLAASVNHMAEELGQLYQQLEVASRHKSDFLASMSHELRTPLNAILGYSEMLQEEAEDLGQETFIPDLQKISAAGKHLLDLINDILDLSKIEAGKMTLYLESFPVASLVRDVSAVVQPLAEKNGNTLEVRCADDLGTMRADLTKVRQVLFNLLTNASKFTDHGTISLGVSRETVDDVDWLQFVVADTGIGMTVEQMDRLFEAFSQAEASTTRQYGGTGLGLAISRQLSEMMGGTITVASEYGQGSTFTIRLPAEVADPALLPAPPRALAEPAAVDGRTVLVIDDDPTVRDLMQRYLSAQGVRVQSAAGGEEGLRLARELRPDAITLDVLMPGMDGWAVLAALKAAPELADIPVIMLTILDDRNLGYALGAADFLTKPIDRERLAAMLRKHLRDRWSGAVLVVDDDAMARELLRRTAEGEGWTVDEAENGRVALEHVAAQPPGLILLDLMMPEMDGFEFVAALRKRPEWRTIPIVVITAKDLTPEDHQRLNGSVERILQKGASTREELLTEVRDLVAASGRQAAAAQL